MTLLLWTILAAPPQEAGAGVREALVTLEKALAAQGKLEEALAVADVLAKTKPRAEEFGMDLRVAVYAIAGKREAAIEAVKELLDKHPGWHAALVTGDEFDEFRRLPAVQDLLRKARAKVRK